MIGRVTCTHDPARQLTKLKNGHNEVTTLMYDDAGRKTESKLANGTKTSFTYDAANQKKGVVNVNSTNTTLSYYNYQFDGVGDRTSLWDNGVDVSNWNYDFTGQLTNDVYRPATTALNWNGLTVDQWSLLSVSGWDNLLADHVPTGGAGLLAYSPTGNRLTQTDPVTGDITTFAYDSGNRLLTAVDVSGTTTHTYDDNGNQLTIAEPSGDITTNTWDGENRLIQVEHPSGDVTTYAYNGDGLRVLQDDGVAETRFVYDGNNLVLELDDVGVVKADVTYLPAEYATAISQHRDLESSFYLCDGIHNVRQLTDDAQVVTDEYSFDGWGKLTSSTGSTANSQLYKGEYLAYRKDPDAGPEVQYAMHHRNYNPKSGVFTAADPAKDDLNFYRYVHNNPVNLDDPSGLAEIKLGRWIPDRAKSNVAPTDTTVPTLFELQEKFARTKAQLQKANEALEAESQKCFLTHSEARATELFARSDFLRERLREIRDEIQSKYGETVSTRERVNRPETQWDWGGFSDGWKRSWTLNPQASVDGYDTALKVGQWTATAVGVVAGSIVAAKGLVAAGVAAAPTVTATAASAKATVAAGAALVQAHVFVQTHGERLLYTAQNWANFFNQNPFWRDRIIDGLEAASQTNSVEEIPETAARGALIGWAFDAAPGALASLKNTTREAWQQFFKPRSFTAGMGLGGFDFTPPSNRKPKAPDLPDCTCDAPNPSSSKKPDVVDNPVPEPKPSTSKPVQPETSTLDLPDGNIVAPNRLSGRQGLAYDTKHLNKHLPNTPEALKLIEKEGAAHVFVDEATLRRVEQAVLEGGEFTGSLRNAERYGLRFDEVIGYRIDAAGNRIPLHYAELKLDPATGKYHLIPRTGPATPGKGG